MYFDPNDDGSLSPPYIPSDDPLEIRPYVKALAAQRETANGRKVSSGHPTAVKSDPELLVGVREDAIRNVTASSSDPLDVDDPSSGAVSPMNVLGSLQLKQGLHIRAVPISGTQWVPSGGTPADTTGDVVRQLSGETVRDAEIKQALISAIRHRRCLWDRSSKSYYNAYVRRRAWREVAQSCKLNVNGAKTRWKGLKDYYIRRRKRHLASLSGAASAVTNFGPFTSQLSFLDNSQTRGSASSSFQGLAPAQVEDPLVDIEDMKLSIIFEPFEPGKSNSEPETDTSVFHTPVIMADECAARQPSPTRTGMKPDDIPTRLDARRDTLLDTRPIIQLDTEPDSRSDTSQVTTPDTRLDDPPDTRPDTQPDTRQDTRPVTRPDTVADTKPVTRPDTDADTKPDNRPESRSETGPDTSQQTHGTSSSSTTQTSRKRKSQDLNKLLLKETIALRDVRSDPCELFGRFVAAELRRMTDKQRQQRMLKIMTDLYASDEL